VKSVLKALLKVCRFEFREEMSSSVGSVKSCRVCFPHRMLGVVGTGNRHAAVPLKPEKQQERE